MRYLILLLTTFFMVGCFDETSIPTASNDTIPAPINIPSVQGINISGKVNLTNAGGIDASSISVILGDLVVHPKDDGTYLLSGNISKVAARAMETLDTVKIVVAGDTLVEVPVESWSAILPTNYIVQRNVSCVISKKFSGSSVQAVFWDNDSIARVLNLGKGTTKYKFSGFIYTAYNDSQFKTNTKLYDIFARVKMNDSIVAYTEISEVTAKVGNVDFDSTQFEETYKHITYLYTRVPNDSSVAKYNDTIKKTLVIDTIYDTIHNEIDTNKFIYIGHDSINPGLNRYEDDIYDGEKDSIVFSSEDSVYMILGSIYSITFDCQIDTISFVRIWNRLSEKEIVKKFHFTKGENTFQSSDYGNMKVDIIYFDVRGHKIIIKSAYQVNRRVIKHYI